MWGIVISLKHPISNNYDKSVSINTWLNLSNSRLFAAFLRRCLFLSCF